MACPCMQPFPYRNAEQRSDEAKEEKNAHERRRQGPSRFKKLETSESVKEKLMGERCF